MDTLFRGMYEHQVDDKGRIRIPVKFKKGLDSYDGGTYSFVRGYQGCIYVFPDSVLDEILEELAEERLADSSKASLMFFGMAYSAEEDQQGRVTLPPKLKELAEIKKDVVTIGRGKRLEIWAAEKLHEYMDGVSYDEEFKKLGI